jgi:TRAP-type C4-dicarboxylate transport system substrate-binding protein
MTHQFNRNDCERRLAMKRKSIAILITLTLMVGFVCAFPAPAVSKVIKWNVNIWGGPRAWTRPIEHWAEDMGRYTDGQWQIKIHYGAVLAPPKEVLDGIRAAMFEATGVCMAYHPGKTPLHRVMELPFIAPTETIHLQLMQHAMWEHPALRKELLRWNAVPLLPAGLPTYHLMGNKALRSVEDLKGARIRIGGDIAKVLKEFGAVPTLVPAPEVYETISRGTIDLVGLPHTYAQGSYKIFEASKYYNLPMTLGTMSCPVVANKNAWNALPEEWRKLNNVWYDLAPYVWSEEYAKADRHFTPIFRKKLQYIEFPNSEREKIVAKAKPIWDAWVKEMEAKGLPGKGVMDFYFKKRKEIAGY